MKNSKGFSLLETIMVVAVIAILSAIAVPSIINQRNDANLRDAVSMIRGDFEAARSRAIRENAFVPFIINAAGDGYTVFIDNGSGAGETENWTHDPPNERSLCDRKLPAGIKIDLAATKTNFTDPAHLTSTRFNGRGYITNNGFLTFLCANGKSAKIDMDNRFGRITTTYY